LCQSYIGINTAITSTNEIKTPKPNTIEEKNPFTFVIVNPLLKFKVDGGKIPPSKQENLLHVSETMISCKLCDYNKGNYLMILWASGIGFVN
jgi:hypothetical protein